MKFYGYPFTGKTAKIMAGSLLFEDGKAVIGINETMITGRQNHTKLHEIVHLNRDVPLGMPGESLASLLEAADYSPQEQYREAVANFAASMLHIPLVPMIRLIQDGVDLDQGFSLQFGSSHSANFTRLRDFIEFGQGASHSNALNYAMDYRSNPANSYVRDVFIRQFGSKFQEVELDGDHRFPAWADFDSDPVITF